MRIIFISLFSIGAFFTGINAQSAYVTGQVLDADTRRAVELATVYIKGTAKAAESDLKGEYYIEIPAGKACTLVFSRIGYEEVEHAIAGIGAGEQLVMKVLLAPRSAEMEIVVRGSRIEEVYMIREKAESFKLLPTASGNFESVLPSIALGTSSGTGGELSSQYQVRGGNYDENLVYVNDFEVYRPQLIRAGQQEGLSFPNIDLIRDIAFSSGGFEAAYGDKLSSVLDIRYKRPDSLAGSVNLSLLGGGAHIEGAVPLGNDPYRKFRYLAGARYKSNAYLLGSLDVTGEYTTRFADFQTYLTYDLSRDWQLGALLNYNTSVYGLVPESRVTALGSLGLNSFALELNSDFEGRELNDFRTGLAGFSLTYLPENRKRPMFLKFLASGSFSNEQESFDIIGSYDLYEIEADFGEDQGEKLRLYGEGVQHSYTRNFLRVLVGDLGHKGGVEFERRSAGGDLRSHFLQWGAAVRSEYIFDKINEWERLDSAGYSLPFDTSAVQLFTVYKGRNELQSYRFSGYLQNSYTVLNPGSFELKLNAGVRMGYWTLNREFILSPRVQALFKPLNWTRDLSFKLAAGFYNQPPFYRELRDPTGRVNESLRAQKSFHLVAGLVHDFLWENISPKKFRLTAEAYYKHMWDLVSYELDNVRIRYSGQNDARGYVVGLDARINGEFVPGAESWINLSVLRARERLDGVTHLQRNIGEEEARVVPDVPRPTDQLASVNIFFQDYLPRNENIKVHLNLIFTSGLPFGVPGDNREYRNVFRYRAYWRGDIGFSFQLWKDDWRASKPDHFLSFSRNTWVSLEVFNLMGIRNVANNTWIRSIYGAEFAIPNYLTSRRLNVRLRMDF